MALPRRTLVLAVLAIFFFANVIDLCGAEKGTIFYDPVRKGYSFRSGVIDKIKGVAYGSFEDNIERDGWGRLHVASNRAFPDAQQMYAGGYLEGALTYERIYQQYVNIYSNFFGNTSNPMPAKMEAWLKQQDAWARKQSSLLKNTDNYWAQVDGILQQLDGLMDGYNSRASSDKALPWQAFSVLNGVGDFIDIMAAFAGSAYWRGMTHGNWIYNSHCSALIKVTGNLDDIFAGHTAWFVYAAMLRIAKDYNFDLRNPTTSSKRVVFSSYPGFLESLDDFYITSSKLVVIETTNSIFNKSLYQTVRDHTDVLLSWQRTLLANRIAASGADWAQVYSKYQSGTYNNQWMVLDAKRFQPGSPLVPGTLTILEQIPGFVEWGDLTGELEKGYWPSYNVPYFESIYNMSGYIPMAKSDSVMASYQTCCRANIYRRDQGNVKDLDSFKSILRYNDWQKDPYSFDNPGYSIASRFDLEPTKPGAFGGYDTKATSFKMINEMSFDAINGPTYQDQQPFEWTDKWASVSHIGQPKVFHFPFITFRAEDF